MTYFNEKRLNGSRYRDAKFSLASNTDFSLISLFLRADVIVKSVIIILIEFNLFMGNNFEKIRMFRKLIKVRKNLKKNFGSQNLRNILQQSSIKY